MQHVEQYDNIPSGSRLAKYLGSGGPSAGPPRTNTTPMSTMSVNVAPFVPQFAQMNMRENGVSANNAFQNQQDYLGEERGGAVYYFQSRGPPQPMPASAYDATLGSPSDAPISPDTHTLVNLNGQFSYGGPPPHIGKFRPKTAPGNHGVAQFMTPELKQDLANRQLAMKARPETSLYPDMPQTIEHLRDIVPLEPISNKATTTLQQSTYKATSLRDGVPYCVRRIHGFRPPSSKSISAAESWKKLSVVHAVQLRDVITTRAFGDQSLLFLYDYHPLAETLKSKHFGRNSGGMVDVHNSSSPPNNLNPASNKQKIVPPRYPMHGGSKIASTHGGSSIGTTGVPEAQLWSYVVQITAALRTIHASGLAMRSLDASKVIIYGKSKVLLSMCGVQDVIAPDATGVQQLQSEDMVSLGRLLLALATGSLTAGRREQVGVSLSIVGQHYSADIKNIITFLLSAPQRKSIMEIMPMIGARFYNHIESLQMRYDIMENELSRESENGRLLRLLCKLNTIVERPEHNMDASWSETGDRFLIKLFRDYVFHQVTESGKPWMDMAHIVQVLNKLDAGVQERIELVSRDQDNVIIVSYADLRRCIDSAFRELANSAVVPVPRR